MMPSGLTLQAHVPVPITPQRSGWLRTAVTAPQIGAVAGPLSTDVLIVGAGYAGLNAALRTLERGRHVVVVDAEDVGFGGSGRNGGQVIPGLKHDPDEILAAFGDERGRRIVAFAGNAATATFDLIEQYGLNCDATRCGWLQPAVDAATFATAVARAKSWTRASGIDAKILDATQTAALTGTSFYTGGWIDPRGGHLQPLSYARELARVVIAKGGAIFARSLASEILRDGDSWRASVNGHQLRAKTVLLCTNGYSGTAGADLARAVIPASSMICSTRKLTPAERASIIPSGLPISDARRLMSYIRFDRDGRFLIGARGSFSLTEPETYFRRLRRTATKIFPQLSGIDWEDSWGGLFCLTPDFFPHAHQPERGLFTLAGCNGRGVAMLSQLGRALADLAQDGDEATFPFPITPLKPIPFHRLRRPALEAGLLWYRTLDALGL